MSYYSAGTISLVNGLDIVTGELTVFGVPDPDSAQPQDGINVKRGDLLFVGTFPPVLIEEVTNNTQFILVDPWPHASQTDVAYRVAWTGAGHRTNATTIRYAAEILSRLTAGGNLWMAGVTPGWGTGDPPPTTMGEDGDVAMDVGSLPYTVYSKVAGLWSAGVDLTGATGLASLLPGSAVNGDFIQLSGGAWVNRTPLQAGLIRSVKRTIRTASATHTFDANHLFSDLECVGGGGGGGGATASGFILSGGGGGAGAWSLSRRTAAQTGASQAVTVGAAGTGSSGASGGAGGTTSVGALCTAPGGSGGFLNNGSSAWGQGANGGVAGTGDISIPGQFGQPGLDNGPTSSGGRPLGGMGGSTRYGSGGCGTVFSIGGTSAAGYGAGGGGGGHSSGSSAGGNGAPGLAIITEYCAA